MTGGGTIGTQSPPERLDARTLARWRVPDGASARLINLSENATYLVEAAGGYRAILRVHREGYHSRLAIECELAWIDALRRAGTVPTRGHVAGRDGEAIQTGAVPGLEGARHMVLFEYLAGAAPDESGDLVPGFEELGAMAARCHEHASGWTRPVPFERLAWDERGILGPNPIWGDWRAAPNLPSGDRETLERVERLLRERLAAFGKGSGRYGLIHADMRLANLLVDGSRTRLIDFDDCGEGWFLYDFAAAISFMEDDPRVSALLAAWLRGYRSVRALPAVDEAEIGSFVMLRRLALLAWVGSRSEATEPQALAPHFARVTARLGRGYLAQFT